MKFIWDNGVSNTVEGEIEEVDGDLVAYGTFTTVHDETYPFRSWIREDDEGDAYFTIEGVAYFLDEVEWEVSK